MDYRYRQHSEFHSVERCIYREHSEFKIDDTTLPGKLRYKTRVLPSEQHDHIDMAVLTSSVLLTFFLLPALARASVRPETRAVSDASLTDVSTAFSKAGIVPGLVPVFKPTRLLDVVFTDPTTQKAVNATPGTNLTMQRKLQLLLSFWIQSDTSPRNRGRAEICSDGV